MVKHGMDIIKQITNHVNPRQTPVLTVDQPLYAIAKIQMARAVLGITVCDSNGRSPYRDGHVESHWRLARRKWMDTYNDSSKCDN